MSIKEVSVRWAIPIIVSAVVATGGATVWMYHEFTTKAEAAGISLNQQMIGTRNQIKWLEHDLDLFYKKHGKPPYSDPRVQDEYEKLKGDLKAERDFLRQLNQKLKK